MLTFFFPPFNNYVQVSGHLIEKYSDNYAENKAKRIERDVKDCNKESVLLFSAQFYLSILI